MKQTAVFVKRPRRIEELAPPNQGKIFTYQVVREHRLNWTDFENFATDMLADRAFLENTSGCGVDNGLVCCLRITCPRRGAAILVLPDETGHVDLAAVERPGS